jgi:hypothetical protein
MDLSATARKVDSLMQVLRSSSGAESAAVLNSSSVATSSPAWIYDELRHLRYFIVVAETGSLTVAAAKAAHLAAVAEPADPGSEYRRS